MSDSLPFHTVGHDWYRINKARDLEDVDDELEWDIVAGESSESEEGELEEYDAGRTRTMTDGICSSTFNGTTTHNNMTWAQVLVAGR